jgi:CPA2 family monovalent cation:H+ antiporter-2
MVHATEFPLLVDVTMVLGISIIAILFLHRLNLPTVIGFLLSGMVCGPYTLNLVKSETQVEQLAEIGVVLLLFMVGLEFSLAGLMRIKRAVLIGGAVQVIGTIVVMTGIAYLFFHDYFPIALFMGFMTALSSTAIVLKLLQENSELAKESGQISLGILIFQDLAVIPMMLAVPLLIETELQNQDILFLLLKIAGVGLFTFVCIKYLVPKLLYHIASIKSKDLFIITIVVLCFAIAWITSQAGLSLALGAFLAGLCISESKYGYEAAGSILPFKEVFTSIFFVSVGMLIDIGFLVEHLFEIFFLVALIVLVKMIVVGGAVYLLKANLNTMMLVGFSLAQVGEFSLVLMKTGVEVGIVPVELNQYFLSVTVVSMTITPFMIRYKQTLADKIILRLPLSKRNKAKLRGLPHATDSFNIKKALTDHIVIVGYELTGKSIAYGAKQAGIPFVVIELDPHIVETESKNGLPIIYGDADNDEVLRYAAVKKAKAVVISTINKEKTELIAYKIKLFNPDTKVIARTQYNRESDSIKRNGADVVIADDVESNLEVLMEVMDIYDVSPNEIYQFASYIRGLV